MSTASPARGALFANVLVPAPSCTLPQLGAHGSLLLANKDASKRLAKRVQRDVKPLGMGRWRLLVWSRKRLDTRRWPNIVL